MVMSYATSPVYHIVAEEDDSKAAAIFEEGHYLTAEGGGNPFWRGAAGSCRRFHGLCPVGRVPADDRLCQLVLPVGPAARGLARGECADLPFPETPIRYDEAKAEKRRGPALDLWLQGMTR